MTLWKQNPDSARWLAAGLCLMRVQTAGVETIRQAKPWLLAYLRNSVVIAPLGLVADIGFLLAGYTLQWQKTHAFGQGPLRKAVVDYEDHFINRLIGDKHFQALRDAFQGLPAGQQPEAVAFVSDTVLQRLALALDHTITTGFAIRLLKKPANEWLEHGNNPIAASSDYPDDAAPLSQFYQSIARKSRHLGNLLSDYDVLTVENLSLLRSLTQRTMFKQVVDAAEQLHRGLPKRIRKNPRAEGAVVSRIKDDSTYPTGGFSSISNAGSLENLVCSELIYLEDGADFDLFDVRYCESELLYYTRDDSVFHRLHRDYGFYLHSSLAQARIKDAELPWQRSVLMLALILVTVRKLIDCLSEEALTIRIRFADALQEERGLSELLFREWIDKGIVSFDGQDDPEEAPGVLFSCAAQDCAPHTAVFNIARAQPVFLEKNTESSEALLPPWPAWHAAVNNLLKYLV